MSGSRHAARSLPPLPTLHSEADSSRSREKALSILSRLNIVTITPLTKDKLQTVTLTKNFRSSLRLALTGGGDHQSFGVPSSNAVEGVDIDFLDHFATDKWEGILHYIVNSLGNGRRQGGDGPSPTVIAILEAGHLVQKGRHSGSSITKLGFGFLLQEVNAQVWTLLLLWVRNAEHVCFSTQSPLVPKLIFSDEP